MAATEDIVPQSPDDVEFDHSAAELGDRKSSPPRYDIATWPADFTLEGLHTKWNADDLVIPSFQLKLS